MVWWRAHQFAPAQALGAPAPCLAAGSAVPRSAVLVGAPEAPRRGMRRGAAGDAGASPSTSLRLPPALSSHRVVGAHVFSLWSSFLRLLRFRLLGHSGRGVHFAYEEARHRRRRAPAPPASVRALLVTQVPWNADCSTVPVAPLWWDRLRLQDHKLDVAATSLLPLPSMRMRAAPFRQRAHRLVIACGRLGLGTIAIMFVLALA